MGLTMELANTDPSASVYIVHIGRCEFSLIFLLYDTVELRYKVLRGTVTVSMLYPIISSAIQYGGVSYGTYIAVHYDRVNDYTL